MSCGRSLARITLLALVASCVWLSLARRAAAALVTDPGCDTFSLARNDDAYSDPVPLGFDVYFGGEVRSSLRINNNGYVTFGPITPFWFSLRAWEAFSVPLIAAFHADVDTTNPSSNVVKWGPIQIDGQPALCINWLNVGYFDAQADKLNRFQLILVKGTAPGDFDVIMNYDRIVWENGNTGNVGGVGGLFAPRVGIYNGTNVVVEHPHSNQISVLLDGGANALTAGNTDGNAGEYIYHLHEDGLPPGAIVTGYITDTNGDPVAAAQVAACPRCIGYDPNVCHSGTSEPDGRYRLTGFTAEELDCGSWEVMVSPPTGSNLLTNTLPITLTSTDQIVSDADIVLDYPLTIPDHISISPSSGDDYGGTPVVYWQSDLTLDIQGCGSPLGDTAEAWYWVTQAGNAPASCTDPFTGAPFSALRCPVQMTEIRLPPPSIESRYVATVPRFAPTHGLVEVHMTLRCSTGLPANEQSFNMYIDPSGWVRTTRGAALAGAKVTLLRSSWALGPFTAVPDGSPVMSPKNRTNPDFTDAEGHFGWDTMPGYYVVRAEYPGCVAPGNLEQTYVETDVLPVPPEWTDLNLVLDCEGITPPELRLPGPLSVAATEVGGARVTYTATAWDGRDGDLPANCAPASGSLFPVGVTTVECSASDSSGNVARGSFTVQVGYSWTDVLRPLSPTSVTQLQRGRTVPVRFALTGASAGITDLVAALYVAPIIDGVPGPEQPAQRAGRGEHAHGPRRGHHEPPPAGPYFRYDDCSDQYLFEWSTRELPAGLYQLRIDLGDGAQHTVQVRLRGHEHGHGHGH